MSSMEAVTATSGVALGRDRPGDIDPLRHTSTEYGSVIIRILRKNHFCHLDMGV